MDIPAGSNAAVALGAEGVGLVAATLVCLFWILIPLLMKGASTLLTVFLVCAYITVVTMVILPPFTLQLLT